MTQNCYRRAIAVVNDRKTFAHKPIRRNVHSNKLKDLRASESRSDRCDHKGHSGEEEQESGNDQA